MRDRLLQDLKDLAYSVSCTTRPPRAGEVDGKDYHFLTEDRFRRLLKKGEFLERAIVHGRHYGTLRRHVVRALARGRDVLMVIDVQGAGQVRRGVRRLSPDDPLRRGFVDIFIAPPRISALRSRLMKRGLDSPEVIEQRLKNAAQEMSRRREYQYVVINDRLEEAYAELRAILAAEHCRVVRRRRG